MVRTTLTPVRTWLFRVLVLVSFNPQGYSAWGVGSLNYINRSTRAEWQAFASSAVRYLPDFQEFHSVMHTGGVNIGASLPNRFRLTASAALAYSPSYLYSLFPTLPSASEAQPVVDYSDPYDLDPSSSVLLERLDRIGASSKSEVKH